MAIGSIIGGGGMQAGVILYDNEGWTNGSVPQTVKLSESAANFDALVICYKTYWGNFASTTVVHPDGKVVCLHMHMMDTSGLYYVFNDVAISGNTISTRGVSDIQHPSRYTELAGGAKIDQGEYAVTAHYVGITQVIGIRKI